MVAYCGLIIHIFLSVTRYSVKGSKVDSDGKIVLTMVK